MLVHVIVNANDVTLAYHVDTGVLRCDVIGCTATNCCRTRQLNLIAVYVLKTVREKSAVRLNASKTVIYEKNLTCHYSDLLALFCVQFVTVRCHCHLLEKLLLRPRSRRMVAARAKLPTLTYLPTKAGVPKITTVSKRWISINLDNYYFVDCTASIVNVVSYASCWSAVNVGEKYFPIVQTAIT